VACPARFERATSALEEIVAAGNSNKFNGLSQKTSTVQRLNLMVWNFFLSLISKLEQVTGSINALFGLKTLTLSHI
jgi:hypothetical protein